VTLVDRLDDAMTVAFSRLWRRGLPAQLEALDASTIEIPHLRGVPIDLPLPSGTIRLAEWPNAAGILEPIDESAVVRWDEANAPRPPTDRYIRVATTDPQRRLGDRIEALDQICRRLAQIRGVSRVATGASPIAMLITPGFTLDRVGAVLDAFPESVEPKRHLLGEFPGGLGLVATDGVCELPTEYAACLEEILARKAVP
jgi:hypothetical protein